MKFSRIRIVALFALSLLFWFLFSSRHVDSVPEAKNRAVPSHINRPGIAQTIAPSREPAAPESLTSHTSSPETATKQSDTSREIYQAIEVTDSFRQWLESQSELSSPAVRKEGAALLKVRRSSMVTLIRNAPEQALAQALSYAERECLPEEWRPFLEERFSTVASMTVLPDCSSTATGSASHIMIERADQSTLHGETWGQMNGYQSKNELPIEGIALDQWAALADNGVKLVSGLELEAVERLFPLAPSAHQIPPDEAHYSALVGGNLLHFATKNEMQTMRSLYATIASLPGPDSAVPLIAALNNENSPNYEDIRESAQIAANAWTETPKSVLVLNLVYPDDTTPIATQVEWQDVMSQVSDWLSNNAYGKTNLVVTVPPHVFTLPSPKTNYQASDNYYAVMTEAKALALAAGYASDNYDITVVAFPHTFSGWSGRASVGGSLHWLNGSRSVGTIAHEFGHNYGLWHASSWDVNDGSIMPGSGAPNDEDSRHQEYGDLYSVMGYSGSLPKGNFSPHGLSNLNWMTASKIETVSTPGVYRVYRFDDPNADSNPRLALKLQRAGSQTFWLGYRRNFTSNAYLSNGAYLTWQYVSSQCRLLDMTPDSRTNSDYSDKEDAALALGQTFIDPTGSLYITPIGQGGTPPDEWLDVQVEFSIAGNEPPTASITLPTGPVAARTPITLVGSASDPNGDTLTYVWDLGNGQTATGEQVDLSFEAGGTIDISLRVTDGKGGLVEITEQLQVSDPLTEIEELNLPVTGTLHDGIQHRGLHLSSNYYYSMTSPDGATWYQNSNNLSFTPQRYASGTDRVVAVSDYYDSASSTTRPKTAVSIDGTQWDVQFPVATGGLNSVAYHAGTFAAVGDGGIILTSLDGITWASRSGTSSLLYDVAVGDNGFIACGQNGTIITSPNGIAWTAQTTPETWPSVQSLATHGEKVAGVGMGGEYWWSENDGIDWESRSFGLSNFSPTMITHGENLWIAAYNSYVSASASYELKLAVSSDGLKWGMLPSIVTISSTRNIRIEDGRLWIYGATGQILRSALLETSNNSPTIEVNWPSALTVRSDINLSATVNDADGDAVDVFWDLQNHHSYQFGSTVNYTPLAGGQITLTAWASDGRGGHSFSSHAYDLDDPLTEIEEVDLDPLASSTLYDGIQFNGLDIILHSNGITSSSDGSNWQSRILSNFTPSGIATGTDRIVVVGRGYDYTLSGWFPMTVVSTDGVTWTYQNHDPLLRLNAVAFAAGVFVAVGDDGIILTSPDGSSWTSQSVTTQDLYSVITIDSGFVTSGQQGTVMTSLDGGTWIPASTPTTSSTLRSLATDGVKVAGVGLGGEYWWSDNGGIDWESRSFGLSKFSPTMITHGENLWIAAYSSYVSASASYELNLAVSSDGLKWGMLPSIVTSSTTRSIRLEDGRLWIYGATGKILRSALLETSNNAPTIEVNWPAALTVRSDINLSATVNDADGDAVDVFWDLHNHHSYQFGSNVTHRFLIGGSVELTAWASDGRGGHSSSSRSYSINDPLLFWSDITPSALATASFVTSTCGNGVAVIAGGSTIADALDDEITESSAWIKRSLPDSSNWNTNGVAYRGPGFVAVGYKYDFSVNAWRSAVRFSSDGQTWSAHQFIDGSKLNAVASADNAYVAVGNEGNIFRSSDGLSWTSSSSGVTTNLNAVAFSGTRGLAVGFQLILRSEDSGLSWEDVTASVGDGFSASGVFEAGGDLYLTRSDYIRQYDPIARTWIDSTVDNSAFGDVRSLILHDSLYLAVTRRYDSTLSQYRRYLLVSEDGLEWGRAEPVWDSDLNTLLSCNGELIAAGSNRIFANIQGEPGLRILSESITATRESGSSGQLANVQLGNTGSNALLWSVSSDVPWLEATPPSGAVSVQTPVQINLLNAPAAGTHVGTLTFSAAGVPDLTFIVTLSTFDDDHGGTIESATQYASDTIALGEIEIADDSDWFSLRLDAPGALTVWTTGTLDTTGELHGTAGRITSDDDTGSGSNFHIEETLLPGRYWVKVDGYSTRTGSYELNSTFVPAGPPFKIASMNTINEGSEWALTVATAIGYSYQVQEAGSLVEEWTPVGDWIGATSEETILTVPIPEPKPSQHFYRITIQAP
ncbi:PKD domain-containing protein [Coraliomargarita sp. W4R72]